MGFLKEDLKWVLMGNLMGISGFNWGFSMGLSCGDFVWGVCIGDSCWGLNVGILYWGF